MILKVVITLSCLCVARAAVFTINAYQDDNELNNVADGGVEQSIEDGAKAMCLGAQCFNFCRSMGFSGGYCVGNACQCQGRRAKSDIEKSSELNNVAEGDVEQSIEDRAKAMCMGAQCFNFCRSMGFSGGYCIGNACHCQGRRAKSDIEESSVFENPDTNSPRSCNLRWCEQTCRRIGFAGGVCVNGRCKCDIRSASSPIEKTFTDFDFKNENEDGIAQSPKMRCTADRCNQLCRKLGFSRGFCVGPNVCRCRGRIGKSNNDEELTENDPFYTGLNNEIESEIAQSPDVRGTCTASRCNNICRRLGFPGGVCVAPNVCRCRGRSGDSANDELTGEDHFDIGLNNEIESEIAQSPDVRGTCTASRCNNICRRLGFPGGVCVGPNVCRCRGRSGHSANDELTGEDHFDIVADLSNVNDGEIAQSPDVRGTCTASLCNEICRRLGFAGGVCVGPNMCQCRGHAGRSASEEPTASEVALIRTVRSCGAAECNRFCIKMGYARGVCIGTYCQCRMRSAVDKYSIFDVNKNEVGSENFQEEESNDIPQN